MFPLYNNLFNETTDKKLSKYKINLFLNKVKTISELEQEIIFALIYKFQLNHKNSINHLPYDGSYDTEMNINFDFNKFPSKLQNILFKFIKKTNIN